MAAIDGKADVGVVRAEASRTRPGVSKQIVRLVIRKPVFIQGILPAHNLRKLVHGDTDKIGFAAYGPVGRIKVERIVTVEIDAAIIRSVIRSAKTKRFGLGEGDDVLAASGWIGSQAGDCRSVIGRSR